MSEQKPIVLEDVIQEILKDLEPHSIEVISNNLVASVMAQSGFASDSDKRNFVTAIYSTVMSLVKQNKAEYVHGKNTVKGLPQAYPGCTDTLSDCPLIFEFFNGTVINLTYIVWISVATETYMVHLANGQEFEVFESRMYLDEDRTKPARYSPREKLIEAWKEAILKK